VADGCEAKVEAVETLPLLRHGGFNLTLNNVLYVSSLRRNLISVASLEDDGYECLFGNKNALLNLIMILLVLPRGEACFICCPLMISL
jgi:hypothetical protein